MRELPAEPVGWRIEVALPFFLLEQADDAHVMYHLSQERREDEEIQDRNAL